MCGIAGICVSPGGPPPAAEELRRMAYALRHRGPDGYGTYLDDEAGLAHTRLAIIDPDGGRQPMDNEDGTIWVVFNGEVFNFVELRAELIALGHRFRTRCDTEVLVHAYEAWGAGAWERLNGQFSIALRDRRQRCLWLVRDRAGITPLFYARTKQAVVFGSEAKSLFASGRIRPRPNPAALAEVFALWAAPGPATVFAGVEAVPAGSAIRFDQTLRAEHHLHARWSFMDLAAPPPTAGAAAAELEDSLRQAVRLRLRADVPVGAYLSGGLDSAVVARMVRDTGVDLQTFALRFGDSRYDEGPAAQAVAGALGTVHHEVVATPGLMREQLPQVVRHCETPLLRAGPIPMFVLSGLVARLGMRVVLTGEGADELLGGYDVFKEDKVRRFWARQPESRIRPRLLTRVHPYVANGAGGMWEAFFRRGLDRVADPFYAHRPRWENALWTLRFLSPEIRRGLDSEELEQRLAAALPAGWNGLPPLARAQQVEIATFMTPYLLASQGDRVLMAHGVEGRYPYLDSAVIGLCGRLTARQKICGLREKAVLRRVARRLLPAETAERRKWPYRAPIAEAFFGESAPEYVRDLLSPRGLAACPLIDAGYGSAAPAFCARAMAPGHRCSEREEMALMGLLTLQLWYREFIDSQPGCRSHPQMTEAPLVEVDRRRAELQPSEGSSCKPAWSVP